MGPPGQKEAWFSFLESSKSPERKAGCVISRLTKDSPISNVTEVTETYWAYRDPVGRANDCLNDTKHRMRDIASHPHLGTGSDSGAVKHHPCWGSWKNSGQISVGWPPSQLHK